MAAPRKTGSTVNKDLLKERARASFAPVELTHILDGGPAKTQRRHELERIISSDPAFSFEKQWFADRSDQYDNAVYRSVKLVEWMKKYNWSREDMDIVKGQINFSQEAITVHYDMVIPALERLTTEEQRKKWLPLALNYKITGAYAQTELGHGTNLRKLETEARFDPATDEFVLNTPRVTSMKWWPGGMGKSATHAIVMAHLYTDGKHCGLQPFIVQLRSLEDHKPMPGITVGDIGSKIVMTHVDNGFLLLKDVRIPRENMLMANAQVSKDGKFHAHVDNTSNYSTMMFVRVHFTRLAFWSLGRGAMIALRYSAVRRQSSLKPDGEESQVLDYQSQQYKIFPGVATLFTIFFTSKTLQDAYNTALPRLLKGEKLLLAEFHSLTSIMKAVCTEISSVHIEIMRQSLGGAGFMSISGLALLHSSHPGMITAEGENSVLYQQTARYLVKQVAAALSGNPVAESVAFLGRKFDHVRQLETAEDCRNMDLLLEVFQKMAQRTVLQVVTGLQTEMQGGLSQDEAWNKNMVALIRAARASGFPYMLKCNVEGIKELEKSASPQLVVVLKRLCCLFALHTIETNAGLFMETEAISLSHLETVRKVEMELFAEIRPDAVALADAIDYSDETLGSILGCYDGNVYEKMYESTNLSSLNQSEVHPSYYKYLRGMIKAPDSKL